MDKVYLSINLYNAIAQYLDTCPANGVRGILNAMEQEVIPQVEAAQAAAQAEAVTDVTPKAE
jgi:hypothetical protein